jgi:hypothetical protein
MGQGAWGTAGSWQEAAGRRQKIEVRREGFFCGNGFQPRFYDFNDSNEFNDLPLAGFGMLDEVSLLRFQILYLFSLTPET